MSWPTVAVGGAMMFLLAADARLRPQRHVLVSPHRAAGAKQSGGNTSTTAQLPSHLAADEHQQTGPARRATSRQRRRGLRLGVGLTASADDAHLEEAYGVFAARHATSTPSTPQTVNTDGWASTQNAFQTLFP